MSLRSAPWPRPRRRKRSCRFRTYPRRGATTNLGEICFEDTRGLRHGSRERSDLIYERYGVAPADRMQYTLDHLIPLEIGGADVVENIWPEPRRSLAGEWDDVAKDQLERRLKVLVCDGELDVDVAQRAIAEDWTDAYRRYVGVGVAN